MNGVVADDGYIVGGICNHGEVREDNIMEGVAQALVMADHAAGAGPRRSTGALLLPAADDAGASLDPCPGKGATAAA